MDTKTVTLAEFLLARIAEDEAEANAATVRVAAPNWLAAFREDDGQRTLVMDSDRLVADCEAKRRIIAAVAEFERQAPPWADEFTAVRAMVAYPLRALAAVYVDHPDYDESWRP